jgi:hypothetical protein
MRTTGKKGAIRNAWFRLGLHPTPKAVAHALMEQGIMVDEELARQVPFEVPKEATGARVGRVSRPVGSPTVRRRPQGFPGGHRG